MPRGFTQANFDVLNARILLLSKTRQDFLNSNVIAIGGIEQFVEATRMFRPKALQLHFFKNACPQIPNSLFELFFDVSPASVSIINTSRDPYMGEDSDNLDIADLPSSMQEVLIASNMAYCLGAMGISAENNNLPQLRQPRSSDFDDSSFNTLKDAILNSFEQGYSARESGVVAGNTFTDEFGDTFVRETVEEVVEETPENTIVYTPPSVSNDEDEEQRTFMRFRASSTDSTPVLFSQSELGQELVTMPIVEGSTVSAQDLGLSADVLRDAILGTELENYVFNYLAVGQSLVNLRYPTRNVANYLGAIGNAGFVPKRINIEAREFGTYIVVNIVPRNGTVYRGIGRSIEPRRFTSNTYRPLLSRLTDNVNTADLPENLRPVKFTGGGNTGRQLQGILAIPLTDIMATRVRSGDIRSVNAEVETSFAVGVLYNRRRDDIINARIEDEMTTSSETTTVEDIRFGSSGYALIGYQLAPSTRLYNNNLKLYQTNQTIGLGNMRSNVFVFYFLGYINGEFNLKQLQWGGMSDYADLFEERLSLIESTNFTKFYAYLRNNIRLSTPNTIKLTDVNFQGGDIRSVKRFLEKILNESYYTPTYSNRVTVEIDLGEQAFNVLKRVPLMRIKDSLPSESSDDVNNQNDELASGSTAQNTQDNARISRSVEAIKTQKIDRTFAYEIEGNWVGSGDNRAREIELRESIREILKEKYENQALIFQSEMDSELNVDIDTLVENEQIENYSINDSQNRRFSITLKLDGSVRGKGISEGDGFETDTRVFIPPNIDLAKTNLDESVSTTMFNRYKFKNDASMWMWNEVFCEALLRSGVRVHKSAGLHIHVSTVDYTEEDRSRYLENYAGFEPLLDLMMPVNSRKAGRSYNASIIQRGSITTGHQKGNRTPDPSPSEWRRKPRTGRSKLRTDLGIQGTGIGTFEFRHPMTSIEPNAVKHFIILAYSFVEVSKIKQFTSFKFKDLESFLPESTATYIYNRIETLAQEDVDSSFFEGIRGVDPELNRRNLA